jgi:hypothetical protein
MSKKTRSFADEDSRGQMKYHSSQNPFIKMDRSGEQRAIDLLDMLDLRMHFSFFPILREFILI